MAGRWSLGWAALTVFLVFGAGQAAAQDFVPDDPRLIEVSAPDSEAIHRLVDDYDVGYETGNRSAVVVVNNDDEIAQLRAAGYTIGKTITGESIGSIAAERQARLRSERLANEFAENGIPARGVKRGGQTLVNSPGEVVIMRAYTFTNYAGKFLYVEAHSKLGTTSAATTANLSVASAGADGVFGTAVPFTMPLGGDGTTRRGTPTTANTCTTGTCSRCRRAPIRSRSAWRPTRAAWTRPRSRRGWASRSRRTCPGSRSTSLTTTWTRPRSTRASTPSRRSSRTSPSRSPCRT